MSRIVVTGAGGYLGGRFVAQLAKAGEPVHAIVREPVPWLEAEQTVCELSDPAAVRLVADLCTNDSVVVHLAGENEVVAARGPAAALSSTILGMERVLEACAAAGVQRIVYVSTVHVYGARMVPGATLTETLRPEPRSTYAISRLACEHLAAALTGTATDLVVLRLTNSVGAPADPAVDRWMLVTNDLCRQGAREGELRLRTSGTQWRDFIAVEDVCRALLAASGAEVAPGLYNLGSGSPTTVRELAGLVAEEFERATGTRPALNAPPVEAEPPAAYHVSVDRSRAAGLEARIPLRAAIAETVDFCLRHREEL